MRKLGYAIVALVALVVSAAPAFAYGGNSGNFARPLTNSDNSVEFRNGSWYFDYGPPFHLKDGFNYYGRLKDTKAEGDYVYVRGRVDGYNWESDDTRPENHQGEAGPAIEVAHVVYGSDPVGQGKIQACRERGSGLPDICKDSDWKYSD